MAIYGCRVSCELRGAPAPDCGEETASSVFLYRPFAVSAMAVRCVQANLAGRENLAGCSVGVGGA